MESPATAGGSRLFEIPPGLTPRSRIRLEIAEELQYNPKFTSQQAVPAEALRTGRTFRCSLQTTIGAFRGVNPLRRRLRRRAILRPEYSGIPVLVACTGNEIFYSPRQLVEGLSAGLPHPPQKSAASANIQHNFKPFTTSLAPAPHSGSARPSQSHTQTLQGYAAPKQLDDRFPFPASKIFCIKPDSARRTKPP